jgi:hypothetical protein
VRRDDETERSNPVLVLSHRPGILLRLESSKRMVRVILDDIIVDLASLLKKRSAGPSGRGHNPLVARVRHLNDKKKPEAGGLTWGRTLYNTRHERRFTLNSERRRITGSALRCFID